MSEQFLAADQDADAGVVGVRHGHTRPSTTARKVIFGALCRACPLAGHCTTTQSGRTLTLHERDELLRAARHDWATDPDQRDTYRKNRPNVESVVSKIASRGGRRLKLRYAAPPKAMPG